MSCAKPSIFVWSVSELVNWVANSRDKIRNWVQICFFAITNSYIKGFTEGTIYTGSGKVLCLPGLNCYSCPGALGSCPIGALQSVLASRDYRFSFYIIGFLMMTGALLGRFVCGWLCPFGLVQDLLHKIPWGTKYKQIKGERLLKGVKYIILIVFVILLPLFVLDFFGQGEPWFCKWICPSGTLMAGWPLVIANKGIREIVGFLFAWKNLILISLILLSVIIYRPFCRFLCPLGAVYGLFNPVSFYQYKLNQHACTHCKKCQYVCKMNIPVYEQPNSMECIRCGDCVKNCPTKAISHKNHLMKKKNML